MNLPVAAPRVLLAALLAACAAPGGAATPEAAPIAPPSPAPVSPPSPAAPPLVPEPAPPPVLAAPRAPGVGSTATLTPVVRDPRDPSAAVDALVGQTVRGGQPGMAVLVLRGGRPVHARGYGVADLDTGAPIDERTMFRLASVSKQFTAMAVMILAERGVLSYDDPIARFLPDVVAGHPGRRAVTIRHLLQHTSGIPDYLELDAPALESDDTTNADVVRTLAGLHRQDFRPGSRYAYCNSNYVLLAELVARASGQTFGAFVRDHIARPLAMPSLMARDDRTWVVPARARGYDRTRRRFVIDDEDSPVVGDGGVFASLRDFVAWESALSSERLVSRRTLDEAFTSGRLRDGSPTGYGFGWEVEHEDGHLVVSHDGSWVGFRTAVLRVPDEALTVVVLANRDDVDAMEVATDVFELFRAAGHAHGV